MSNIVIAICYFKDKNINGLIYFIEDIKDDTVIIKGKLTSKIFKNSYHGFHVHEAGDLTNNCMGACAHFNPYNKNHGGPDDEERHVGDLGNIYFDDKGVCKINMIDKHIKLRGIANIIGRSIVIHLDKDDLGKGKDREESLKTGNAGKRVSCSVIGYSDLMFKK